MGQANDSLLGGGVQECEIIWNERLLRLYDSTNGIIKVLRRTFMEE